MLTFDGPPLWPHQHEAINAAVDTLATGGRATVVMPCGTGKTRTGAATAAQLLSGRATARVLIVAPFLELLAQTIAEWRRLGDQLAWDRIIACCSDPNVTRSQALHGNHEIVTSDPERLAGLASAPGRTLVAVTYHSLHLIAEAHARHAAPSWDLILIDEAHRSVGRATKPWAVIHDNDRIPAMRRQYMTATPKVLLTSGDDVVSMDDEKIFGSRAYHLSFGEARKRGLLADYRVIAPIITNEQVRAAAQMPRPAEFYQSGRSALSPAMLATQIAVLRAAHQYDIRRLISFHNRVSNARYFAGTLPYALDLLNSGERPPGLWAGHVHGTQSLAQRRAALDRLRQDDRDLVVISNARVLGEGIDVPAVDAVAFVDSRSSPTDTIQAIGRALRRGSREGPKTASIIIPVLLAPGEDPESALAASAYAPLWQVVRALATHDEDLAVRLNEQRRGLGADQAASCPPGIPEWLHVTGVPVPDGFAAAITVQTIRSATSSWEEYYAAAEAYYAKNGDLLVPALYRTASGLQLGSWIHTLRLAYKSGVLSPARINLMDAIGMIWNALSDRREKFLAELRAYRAENGNLRIPKAYMTADGFPLGRATNTLRTRYQKGKLDAQYIAELKKAGFIFGTWEQLLDDLDAYYETHGNLNVPQRYRTPADLPLGRTVVHYRVLYRQGKLSSDEIEVLEKKGFMWNVYEARWWENLKALQALRPANGLPTRLNNKYVTKDGVALGSWFHRQLEDARKGRLTAERRTALRAAGVDVPNPRLAQNLKGR
ncbi:DEAD/DEAH box helicase [Spongiactinospora sp. TRM90649]|uniref:DEAD/DEAH box helicase n=1 Tax=Spongiactinospora sp. TRM90649 TaxID=3031114 RepID=UPI0023F6F3EE|nr:DEAD/DEAH box helicase [Spongiactinospora sp. TRM90649]MDF5758410.1 Helicase associated domain protein [Spongiactinospora sp. TRM90649]